jgi:hypothetical protein
MYQKGVVLKGETLAVERRNTRTSLEFLVSPRERRRIPSSWYVIEPRAEGSLAEREGSRGIGS